MALLYLILLLGTLAVVVARGGVDERLMLAVLMFSSIGTLILVLLNLQFDTQPFAFALVEMGALAIILVVAFRSSRFWPLP